MDSALTPKQQRFVAEYLIDLNATQAAIRAGYSKRTANEQGSQLLAKLSIRQAIDAAIAKRSGKLEITAEKVMRDLEDARSKAMTAKDWGPAIRASELQGKHVGMFGERVILTDERNVVRMPHKAESAEEWATSRGKPH